MNQRQIFRFWLPLSATWLMMATEGPFLAAIIARMTDPKYNLAAYGVAFSFALIMEAPVIMIMSAAAALVKDRQSLLKLRRFIFCLNGLVTLVMLLFIMPPVFGRVQVWLGLPPEVARLTHWSVILLLPWPAAIGYRRFYQGVLIRAGLTRRVAYGTVIRLAAMALAALLFSAQNWPGAWVGAAALSAGVMMEALASRIMARQTVQAILAGPDQGSLSYPEIIRFYLPLALTTVLTLGVHPMVTFFIGHSRFAVESLAVLPVVNALGFVFRCFGFSFQETSIALLGENNRHRSALRRSAWILALSTSGAYALVVWTPLAEIWFVQVSGLSPELAGFALWPARLITLLPWMEVFLSFQRALLVNIRITAPISWATGLEVILILGVMFLLTGRANAIGAVAAATGYLVGRIIHNLALHQVCRRNLGRMAA